MIGGLKVSMLEPEDEGIGLSCEKLVKELESWSGCSMKGEGTTSRALFGDLQNGFENPVRICRIRWRALQIRVVGRGRQF